ncbi:MAG: lamin tail domain-containing protein [Methanolinea sp.]|nr:lamin tail domain-containing protein [Methanolinea sp.]
MDGRRSFFAPAPAVILIICLLSAGCAAPPLPPGGRGDGEWSCRSEITALVLEAIDGDTLAVRFAGGREEKVRILGIDTPETSDEGNMGGEYTGITDPEFLTVWGTTAAGFTASLLEGKTVRLSGDCQAGDRDPFDRILAYVATPEGNDFGALLLEKGYARTYTAESFSCRDHYITLEARSRVAGSGLWQEGTATSPATPLPSAASTSGRPVSVVTVHYDAAGDDRNNMNDESVEFSAGEAVNLAGWTLSEGGGITYTFGAINLSPGSHLTLHTGTGTDTTIDLYWGLSSPVLGNDSDSVILRDSDGRVVDTYRWGD